MGGLLTWFVLRFLARSRYESVLREAEKEAEVIKKNKLLEVKEKFLHLKSDLEKQVSQRQAKIQSVEAKLKQREMSLNQRQDELQRKNAEIEAVKENLASQLELVEKNWTSCTSARLNTSKPSLASPPRKRKSGLSNRSRTRPRRKRLLSSTKSWRMRK